MNEIKKISKINDNTYRNNSYFNNEENKNNEEFEELFQEEIKKLDKKENTIDDSYINPSLEEIEASRNMFNAKHNR